MHMSQVNIPAQLIRDVLSTVKEDNPAQLIRDVLFHAVACDDCFFFVRWD